MKTSGFMSCALLAGLAFAGVQSASASGPPRGHHPLPPEAIQACSGLAEGAACSFTMGQHSVTGVCRAGPQDQAVACAPDGPPPALPQEAIQACSGLTEGAACSFTLDGRTMNGECHQGPDGAAIACGPGQPPG